MTDFLARFKARWAAFLRWLYEEPQTVVQHQPVRSDYRPSRDFRTPTRFSR